MSVRKYHGWRDADGTAHVSVNDEPLAPRLDLANHSPTGFEWGYGGSGPAQLALALLADALGNDRLAVRMHQSFKWKVIANLDHKAMWWLDSSGVRATVDWLRSPPEKVP